VIYNSRRIKGFTLPDQHIFDALTRNGKLIIAFRIAHIRIKTLDLVVLLNVNLSDNNYLF